MRWGCLPGSFPAVMTPGHDFPDSGDCCLHLSFWASGQKQDSAPLPGLALA